MSTDQIHTVPSLRQFYLYGALATTVLMAAVAMMLRLGPAWLVSDAALKTLIAMSMLVIPLFVVLASTKARLISPRETVYRLSLILWWYLLVSDTFFDRISDVQGTYEGQYSVDAYGEVATWLAVFVVLFLISIARPGYLRTLFSPTFKWVSFFLILCMVSVVFSPSRAYSAGWCFKLGLAILVLRLCTSLMEDLRDVYRFMWASFWGMIFVIALSLGGAFADPTTMFQGVGGRLNADPVVLSVTSSCLLVVTLMLSGIRRSMWLIVVAILSLATMVLAFGKTGIIAGVVSAMVFLLLQKRVASTIGLIAGAVAVFAILVSTVTQLGNYLKTYRGGSTLTGRTEIWEMGIQKVAQAPLLGHGYLASKFMWVTTTGRFAEAGHLHNGFIEVLYNNGLAGLLLLLMLHAVIIRNLLLARAVVAKQAPARVVDFRAARVLTAGMIALYVDLLINGFFTPAFGGRPTLHFLMFLGVFGVSIVLHGFALRLRPAVAVVNKKESRGHIFVPTPSST